MRTSRMLAILLVPALASCAASRHYDSVHEGKNLSGTLIVEWMEPDQFLFIPKPDDPLVFERYTGETIQPDRMLTDGGSVPRPFWVLRNYSPWGYGPAFIIHDWLFHMQYCSLPGADRWTVEEAATVMSEVMKTMMETPGFDFGDKTTVYLMYRAVQTAPAREAWSNGACRKPPALNADTWKPSRRFEVSFRSSN